MVTLARWSGFLLALVAGCRMGAPADMPDAGTPGDAAVQAAIDTMVAAVDLDRYEADLATTAVVRDPGSPGWQAVQDLCADRFASLGYDVELHDFGDGVNVIGRREGSMPDEVILSAHYDHIAGCPGADDNATGVAAVLEAARVLAGTSFDRTLVVACWDLEEQQRLGSIAYANRAALAGTPIASVYSYEMLGYASDEPDSQQIPTGLDLLFPAQYAAIQANAFRGDFVAIIGDEASRPLDRAFGRHADALGLPWIVLEVPTLLLTSPTIDDLRRSDHASFWDEGYPGASLTDTANFRNPNYHCVGGADTLDTLDTAFALKIVKASVGAAATVLGVRLGGD